MVQNDKEMDSTLKALGAQGAQGAQPEPNRSSPELPMELGPDKRLVLSMSVKSQHPGSHQQIQQFRT